MAAHLRPLDKIKSATSFNGDVAAKGMDSSPSKANEIRFKNKETVKRDLTRWDSGRLYILVSSLSRQR
jgi:hypothetical protein